MALIKCPECSTEVSDQANACPKCACPIKGTQTIEQTSKDLKAWTLGGAAIMCIGVVSCGAFQQPGLGSLLFFIGFVTFVTARIMSWWYHG